MADERIGIHIGLDGADTTIRSLKDLIRYRDELARAKDLSLFNTEKARQEVIRLTTQLEHLRKVRDDMKRTGEDFILPGKFKDIERQIADTEAALRGARVELGNATKQTANWNNELSRTKAELDAARHGIEAIAGAFQKMGDVSGMLGNFASGIGNAFSNMAGLFQSNFIDVVGMKLTAMMTEAFVGHSQDVIARADILKTFEDYMQITGVTAQEANAALDKVDQSIRGLPIGLDESAQRLRRYQMFLGDIDKATNITIGLQKAITAGGANESMKRMAYYQIDRLLSVGELSTARQWNSLITGLGVSVKFLAEAMGEGEMSASELAGAMLNGQYSAEQLLDALAKLGEGGNEGLEKALDIYKGTYESWISNIRFAMVRGTTNLLNAVSDTLESSSGHSILGYMKRVRDGLNDMYKGMAGWVRNNPDLFAKLSDSLERLVDVVQSLQFGSFGTSFFGYLSKTVELIANALTRISGVNLAEFVAFATTIASPLGKLFSAMSSGLPMLLGVFERFKDFDFDRLVNSIINSASLLARAVEGLLRIIPDSVLGDMLAVGLVWGKPLSAAFSGIARAISFIGASSTSAAIGLGSMANGFSKLLSIATGPLGMALGLIGGAILAIGKGYDLWKQEQQELTDYAETRMGTEANDRMIRGFEQQREASRKSIETAKENLDTLEAYDQKSKELIKTITELNSASELSLTDQATMLNAISQLNGMYSDWNIAIDETTGHLDDNSVRVLKNANALKQAAIVAGQQAELEALGAGLAESTSNRSLARNRLEQLIRDNRGMYMGPMAQRYREYELLYGPITENNLTNFSNWMQELGLAPDDKAVAKFVRTYEEYEEQIRSFQNELKAYDEDITWYEKSMDELSGTITKAADEIKKSAESTRDIGKLFDDTFSELIGDIDKAKSAFDDLGETALKTGQEILEGSKNTADAYRKQIEDMEELRRFQIMLNQSGGVTDASGNRITEQEYDTMLKELIERGDMGEISGVAELVRGYSTEDAVNHLYEFLKNRGEIEGELLVRETELTTVMNLEAQGIDVDESKLDLSQVNAAGETAAEAFNGSMATAMRYQREEDMFNETFGGNVDTSESQGELEDLQGAAENASGAMNDLAGAGEKASGGIDRMGNSASAKVGSVDNLAAAASDLSGQLGSAAGQAEHLASAIASIPTQKDIHINVHTSGSMETTSKYAELYGPQYPANGGLIYAAGGKLVGPRGTDTVQAWLTPGEFVQNRRAVNYFGLPFMQYVNNLDLGGALKSLLSMRSIPAFSNGGSVTYNNQRDNHASVTQNIYTNNQNYSQRVALKALGRL